MCYPVSLPLPLQLSPQPAFLPHLWPPHLKPATVDTNPAPRLPPSSTSHTSTDHIDKWVINLSKTPLTKEQLSLLKKAPILPSPPNTPIEAYITATRQAYSKLPAQEVDELRSEVNRILKQQQQQHNNHCNLNPPQCRALTGTQKGQLQGWFLQWTRGWPWSSWTRKIMPTRPKHYYKTPTPIKCYPRIPPANSKTNSSPFSKTSNKQEALPPTNTNNYIPQVQSPQILWPAQNSQNRYIPQAHCFQ